MGKIIRRDRNGKPYFKAPPPPDRALLDQDDGLNRKMKFQENKHIPTGNLGWEKWGFGAGLKDKVNSESLVEMMILKNFYRNPFLV